MSIWSVLLLPHFRLILWRRLPEQLTKHWVAALKARPQQQLPGRLLRVWQHHGRALTLLEDLQTT
jgi:hypothetical protein